MMEMTMIGLGLTSSYIIGVYVSISLDLKNLQTNWNEWIRGGGKKCIKIQETCSE